MEVLRFDSLLEYFPPNLYCTVLDVLKVASDYRTVAIRLTNLIEVGTRNWEVAFSQRLHEEQESIFGSLTLDCDYFPVLIEKYKQYISSSYDIRDHSRQSLEESMLSAKLLESFNIVYKDLERQALEQNIPIPWQISYSCERDPFATESTENAIVIGGQLVNADGSILFEDTCACCSIVIQSGLNYGKGIPRYHCLDCIGVTLCQFCVSCLQKYSLFLSQDHRDLKDDESHESLENMKVLLCHLKHRIVVEHNESTMLRETNFDDVARFSLPHLVFNTFRYFGPRPCFGTVKRCVRVGNGTSAAINGDDGGDNSCITDYCTYQFEYESRMCPVMSSLKTIVNIQDRIGISFSGTRLFYNLEMAIIMLRGVSVCIPDSWSAVEWIEVAHRAAITIAFVSNELLQRIQALDTVSNMFEKIPSLKFIILINHADAMMENLVLDEAEAARASLTAVETANPCIRKQITWIEFLQMQSQIEQFFDETSVLQGNLDDETIIIHSSGTTGAPKGIIQRARTTFHDIDQPTFVRPLVEFSYLPPYWGTDKLTVWRSVINGGCVAFAYSSSSTDLFDQMTAVQPSALILVPAIVQLMQAEFNAKLDYYYSSRSKIDVTPSTIASTNPDRHGVSAVSFVPATMPEVQLVSATARAIAAMQKIIGTRCTVIGIGGAAVAPPMVEFLHKISSANVVNAYGTSECSGITSNNVILSNISVFLLDRRDLGYTNADLPYPRGEICVKNISGQVPISQWLCNDLEKLVIADRYLANGYFRTGDIGMMPNSNELFVIDRAVALIKLSNGIFVSPEKIEACLLQLEEIHQLIVVANNSGNALIAILVPRNVIRNELTVDSTNWIRRLQDKARASGLLDHEIPQAAIVESELWTPENKSLLFNHKVNRREIRKRHELSLQQESVSCCLVSSDNSETVGTSQTSNMTVIAKEVTDTLCLCVGCCPTDLDPNRSLLEHGLTSIGFLRLIEMIHNLEMNLIQKCVLIKASCRLSIAEAANSTPMSIIKRLQENVARQFSQLDPEPHIPMHEQVEEHQEHQQKHYVAQQRQVQMVPPLVPQASSQIAADSHMFAQDRVDSGFLLTSEYINKSLDDMICNIHDGVAAATSSHSPIMPDMPAMNRSSGPLDKSILVTGATGYFGKFLVCKLLRELQKKMHGSTSETRSCGGEGGLICLVRARNADHARQRITAVLLSTMEVTINDINVAFEIGLLSIVIGDVTRHNLGLESIQQLQHLALSLSCIIHAATNVKFYDAVFGTKLLFDCNVCGTSEMMKLACLTTPPIAFVYVSTMSCSNPATNIIGSNGLKINLHDDPTKSDFNPQFVLQLDAYSVTKQIAEVLVRKGFSNSNTKCISARDITSNSTPELHESISLSARFQILRLPLLTWSQYGVSNTDDWLHRLLITCLQMNLIPNCQQVKSWQQTIRYLPADICAAIVTEHCSEWLQFANYNKPSCDGDDDGDDDVGFNRKSINSIDAIDVIDVCLSSVGLNVHEVLSLTASYCQLNNDVLAVVPDFAFLKSLQLHPLEILSFGPLANMFAMECNEAHHGPGLANKSIRFNSGGNCGLQTSRQSKQFASHATDISFKTGLISFLKQYL